MAIKLANNAKTNLSAGINAAATSISVLDGSVFPTLAADEFFYMTLEDAGLNREIVRVTARSGNTLTVVRGEDGTTARAFSINDKAEGRVTVLTLQKLTERGVYTDIAALQASSWTSTTAPLTVTVSSNYVANDGGGVFRLDLTDSTTLDDGGCVIVTASGLRYKRRIDYTHVNLLWYGVGNSNSGRTSTQNSAGIAAAMAFANANNIGVVSAPPASRSVPIKIKKTIDRIGLDNIRIVGQGAANFGIHKTCFRWDGHAGGVMYRTNKECRYVKVVSTANVDISTLNNGDTVNGQVLATGDYVLLKDQTLPAQNGPYLIGVSGPATRATWYTAGRADDFVFKATDGSVNPDTFWHCTQDPATVTLGTTALTFTLTTTPVNNNGGGLDGVGFDGYLIAAHGLSLWADDEQHNGVVYVEGCTAWQVIMAATAGVNYMNCFWKRLDISCYFSAAGTQNAANGLKWTSVQGHNSNDVCLSHFGLIRISHRDGIGFDQGASDTNVVDFILIQRQPGGTGESWIIRAGDGVLGDGGVSDWNYSYDNDFYITASTAAPLFESGTKPSISQNFHRIVETSGFLVPNFNSAGTGSWDKPDGSSYLRRAGGIQDLSDSIGRRHYGYTGARKDGGRQTLYSTTGLIQHMVREDAPTDAKIWGTGIGSNGELQEYTLDDATGFGFVAAQWERTGKTPTRRRMFYPIDLPNTGLRVRDTDASHVLTIKPNSNLTADRVVSITTGDADRDIQLVDTAFNPTFTCDTPNDLTVSYAVQLGRYMRIGKMVYFNIEIQFTPTYTTATGSWYIGGLPFAIENTGLDPGFALGRSQNITRPSNATVPQCQGLSSDTKIAILWPLTTGGMTASAITNVPSGVAVVLAISGHYFTAA